MAAVVIQGNLASLFLVTALEHRLHPRADVLDTLPAHFGV